jgi:hypothetical protein
MADDSEHALSDHEQIAMKATLPRLPPVPSGRWHMYLRDRLAPEA